MRLLTISLAIFAVAVSAVGQTPRRVELRITKSSIVEDGQKELRTDAEIDQELAALTSQTPKPRIVITKSADAPFERVVHFLEIAKAYPEFRLGLVTQRPMPQ